MALALAALSSGGGTGAGFVAVWSCEDVLHVASAQRQHATCLSAAPTSDVYLIVRGSLHSLRSKRTLVCWKWA